MFADGKSRIHLFSHYASLVLSNILAFVLFKGTVDDVPGVALGVYFSSEDEVQTKDDDRIINKLFLF